MFLEILALISGLLLFLYWYTTRDYGSFAARGIPEAASTFPFGSEANWRLMTGKKGFINFLDCLYTDYPNDPFIVHWRGGNPSVHVRDIELIKRILIKDFDHFTDRRSFEMDEEANKYFTKMLTVLKGEEWKQMRHIMSPVFTSGKLKAMGGLVQKVGDDMVEHLKTYAEEGKPYESKEMMMNFATDAILSSGFGIKADSFKNQDGVIRKQIDIITGGGKTSFVHILRMVLWFMAPKLFKWFKLTLIPQDTVEFFVRIIRDAMRQRREGGERRNDFVDLFIDAMRDAGKGEEGEVEEGQFDRDAAIKPTTAREIDADEYELLMVSNAMLLFFAGFETSSTIMSVSQWFLAKNPQVQETLYQEVKETIERSGTERLDYTTVQNMEYIDMFIHEVLRHYPLAPLERECVKEYRIPDSNMVVKPGMLVQVSAALMQDPQYFPNPTEFNPLNFSAEAKKSRSPYAFLGFGQGPRNCMGMRFALLQLKVALSRLVYNFKVVPNDKTVDELVVDPKSRNAAPIGQCWVSLEMRDREQQSEL